MLGLLAYSMVMRNTELALGRIYLSENEHLPNSQRTFVYAKFQDRTRKLIILMQDVGDLRAGEFNRKAVIYHSIREGSMYIYIEVILAAGFNLLVMNPNEITYYESEDGEIYPIPGSETPEKHVRLVWDYVMAHHEKYNGLQIIAHRQGCKLLFDLQQMERNVVDMTEKIVFIDSHEFIENYSTMQTNVFRLHTHRFEAVCPSKDVDDKCFKVELKDKDPALLPHVARRDIFSFLDIPNSRPRSKSVPTK